MVDQYNKLVRDHIPELIKQQGKIPKTASLDDQAYFDALNAKLQEEVAEYLADFSVEELADIAEVLYALAKHQGVPPAEFDRLREQKHAARGGFDSRIFLLAIEHPSS